MNARLTYQPRERHVLLVIAVGGLLLSAGALLVGFTVDQPVRALIGPEFGVVVLALILLAMVLHLVRWWWTGRWKRIARLSKSVFWWISAKLIVVAAASGLLIAVLLAFSLGLEVRQQILQALIVLLVAYVPFNLAGNIVFNLAALRRDEA